MSDALHPAALGPLPQIDALPELRSGLRAILGRLFVRDLMRYGLASAAALALDWGTMIGAMRCGASPLTAAAAGFVLGLGASYLLSVFFVFPDRRHNPPVAEALAFVAIGLAGLGVNQLMLWALIHKLALMPAVAKGPTAIVVFLFNFIVRRTMLFSAPAR